MALPASGGYWENLAREFLAQTQVSKILSPQRLEPKSPKGLQRLPLQPEGRIRACQGTARPLQEA